MTEIEQRAIRALSEVKTWLEDDAFRVERLVGRISVIRDVPLPPEIEKMLWEMVHRFRRQIRDPELVMIAEARKKGTHSIFEESNQ